MPDFATHERNRLSWNAATDAHTSHKSYLIDLLRGEGSTLYPEEVELLGDLQGKRVVHLQCNSGGDTLSLAKMGAMVTGIDISDTAITTAQRFSAESGIPATFLRSDVYTWLAQTDERFDVAFSSYGAVNWLSDVETWAQGIHRILQPGGRFVFIEFHPTYKLFEEGWRLHYDGLGGTFVEFEGGIGDYVALTYNDHPEYEQGVENFRNPYPMTEYNWGVGEVVTAFLNNGFNLRALREYPYSNGLRLFSDMRDIGNERFTMPEGMPMIPMMYGVVAERTA